MADKYTTRIAGQDTLVPGTVVGGTNAQAGKILALDASGRVDASVMPVGVSADTYTGATAENLAAGAKCYIRADGKIANASAGVGGNAAQGFVLAASVAPAQNTIYFEGRNTALAGLTPGKRYFLSDTTPGGITDTPLDGSDSANAGKKDQFVGTAITATSLNFEPNDYVLLS